MKLSSDHKTAKEHSQHSISKSSPETIHRQFFSFFHPIFSLFFNCPPSNTRGSVVDQSISDLNQSLIF